MFINAKDAPFAVAMAILLLGLVRAFEEYPRPSPATTGAGRRRASAWRSARASWAASARSTRWRAGVDRRGRGTPRRPARRRLRAAGRFVVALLPAMLLAYAVMALVWPWAVANPLNPFRAVEYFSHFFEEPWEELFGGALITVPDMPRSYVPTLLALKLPEMFVAARHWAAGRRARRAPRAAMLAANRRAVYLLVALAAALPIAVTVAAAAGDVQRHPAFRLRAAAARGAGRPCRRVAVRCDAQRWRRRAGAAAAIFLIGLACR